MRVAFDAGPWLGVRSGVGRYAQELARGLERRGVELVPYAVALRGSSPEGVRRWRIPARIAQESWRRFGHPLITSLTGRVDIVHATNFVLPPAGSLPGVVTIHDLSFYRDDTFPGGERLRYLAPWSIRRAAVVVTPTEAIAAEVRARFGVEDDRIAVTPEGVAPVFFGAPPLADAALAHMGIRRPFAIAVGTIEPRKNLACLLDAWRAARPDGWMLVLAGPTGWGPGLPEAAGVRPIGWVGDETLPGLLAAAELFCYPSLYEGFGLPPLEAMAAGTPALVGRYSAALEVLGDAAVLVDPTDVDSVAAGLTKLCRDENLRRRLVVAGRARAASFTWDRTARATHAAYEQALASAGPNRR